MHIYSKCLADLDQFTKQGKLVDLNKHSMAANCPFPPKLIEIFSLQRQEFRFFHRNQNLTGLSLTKPPLRTLFPIAGAPAQEITSASRQMCLSNISYTLRQGGHTSSFREDSSPSEGLPEGNPTFTGAFHMKSCLIQI